MNFRIKVEEKNRITINRIAKGIQKQAQHSIIDHKFSLYDVIGKIPIYV